jgi:hypothetical protein
VNFKLREITLRLLCLVIAVIGTFIILDVLVWVWNHDNLLPLVTTCSVFAIAVTQVFKLRGQKMNEIYVIRLLNQLADIAKTLNSIEQALRPDGTACTVEFYTKINGAKVKVDSMFIKIDQVVDLAVAFKDKLGNAAKVDGLPVWALTDESLAGLVVAADGLSAVLTPVGIGAFKVQVKADADLGEGVKEIIGELVVEVSPLEAEFVEIAATVRV